MAKWLACCYIIISTSSSRHHKQLQHRTGCPEGLRKRCLSSYKSHSQIPCNWSGNETIIIQVSFPDPFQLVWKGDYHHTSLIPRSLSIGLERRLSLYKSHSQIPFNWSGNETVIIQVSGMSNTYHRPFCSCSFSD